MKVQSKAIRILISSFVTFSAVLYSQTNNELTENNDSIPKDNYYTIESAEKKVLKTYPDITRINTNDITDIKSDLNLVYKTINNRKLHLDIYRPMHSTIKNPAIILIHGGAWRSGNRSMEEAMAMHLANNGFVAATVEYRLSPESKYPAAVFDLKSAVRWLRFNALKFDIDSTKIGAYGCSSGGHLASLLGVTNGIQKFEDSMMNNSCSSNIQAAVNVDGPLDLTNPEESGRDLNPTKPSACKLWFGYSYNEKPDLWKEASPLNYVSKKTVPIAFLNSSLEQYHVGQEEMIIKLKANKIFFSVHTIADSPHSFWLFNPWFNETLKFTVDFFNKYLKTN